MRDNDSLASEVVAAYPSLRNLPRGRLCSDLADCDEVPIDRDRPVFAEGAACPGFPLLLEGEVRVARSTAHGREIELYRVLPGEFCLVSAACLFGGQPLPACARTTIASRVVVVPRETFFRWTDDRDSRAALIASLGNRLTELMTLIDTILSQRLDSRLAGALLGHGPVLNVTHQGLADDLGTSREIVSRLLGRFESESLVRLGREKIEILDPVRLRALAGAMYPESQIEDRSSLTIHTFARTRLESSEKLK